VIPNQWAHRDASATVEELCPLHKEIVAVAAVALPQSVYRSQNLDPILVRIFTLLGLENGYKWV